MKFFVIEFVMAQYDDYEGWNEPNQQTFLEAVDQASAVRQFMEETPEARILRVNLRTW
jgi:hypothetical protein